MAKTAKELRANVHAKAAVNGGISFKDLRAAFEDACARLEAADKFEQAIRSRHNGYDPNTDYPEPNSPKEALDQLLKEAEQLGKTELQAKIEQHRWIPVSEGPPECNKYVFVTNGFAVRRAEWKESKHWQFCCFGWRGPITHWKPIILPKAEPKDNKGE